MARPIPEPEGAAPLIGRVADAARLRRALRRNRLVTVTGTGGVGKSRLVRDIVQQLTDARTGVETRWADLWTLREERTLLPVLAEAVGLDDHTSRDPLEALSACLGERRVLLVLDSCEHVVDACAPLVAELLARCPRLTVLATSRRPLRLPGEHVVRLGPLSREADALNLLGRRAAEAGAPLKQEDGAAARQICRRLEGVPLALELAAAQLRHISVQEVARRLGSQLRGLGASYAERRPARHASLRTTVGWSHELCAPHERMLWARLSVLRGTFTEDDARAVCADAQLTPGQVTAALRGLVEHSVVAEDRGRLRMLDTLREYGGMWLGALGLRQAFADRHAAHYTRLVERADSSWLGPGQDEGFRHLAQAHPDVCAALDHLIDSDPERALEPVGGLGLIWVCGGHVREAEQYARRALAATRVQGPDRTRALRTFGFARAIQGEHDEAYRTAARCHEESWRDGDGEGVVAAGYLTGIVHLLHGRPLAALHEADLALALAPADPFASAAGLRCRLVRLFGLTGTGQLDQARREAEELRQGCAAIGEYWARSYADYQLALIAVFHDRPAAAAAHARSMLDAKRRLDDSYGIALGLDLLAVATAAQGRGETAALAYGAGHGFWRRVGHPQRGTPELGPLRERCERQARAQIGDVAYERAFRRGRRQDPARMLAQAVESGPSFGD
ncbi:AAA family ATPase [Streptomyces sp. NPDC001941]|uniref:ATP-binding protein n=1 Tax=Streptomyces sp. NPDC001941 TaxID=3154659 RepID=UPI0033192DFE